MEMWYDDVLRGRLRLVGSNDSSTGWRDVVPKKMGRGRTGYRVKMCIDPENCTKQTYIPGDTVDEPRKAAVWRAQYMYDHPFPAKRPNTKKVCFRPDLKPWML